MYMYVGELSLLAQVQIVGTVQFHSELSQNLTVYSGPFCFLPYCSNLELLQNLTVCSYHWLFSDLCTCTDFLPYCSNLELLQNITVCSCHCCFLTYVHVLLITYEYFPGLCFRVSYCTVDPYYDKVFCYISRNAETKGLECHAFLCSKKSKVCGQSCFCFFVLSM